jgi:hypothetical protein
MTYGYAAYGITFAVPFRCPGLPAARPGIPADVVVSEASVPRALPAPVVSEQRWDAEPGRFLLRGGSRAGRFLVHDGQVLLERNPAAEEQVLARCFTEEVLPVLLRQHGLVILHANTALTPSGAVAIGGESGVGKSTTLMALLERGCQMLADDITALVPSGDGHVEVLPGVAQVNLTEVAVTGLGYGLHPGLNPSWRPLKSALATGQSMAGQPGRLSAIYRLSTHEGADVRVQAATGVEKFDIVQRCIYGPMFSGEHPGAFPLMQAVMRTVDVYELERPAEGWTVAEVVQAILDGAPAAPAGGPR